MQDGQLQDLQTFFDEIRSLQPNNNRFSGVKKRQERRMTGTKLGRSEKTMQIIVSLIQSSNRLCFADTSLASIFRMNFSLKQVKKPV